MAKDWTGNSRKVAPMSKCPIPKEIEDRVKAKVQDMTLDDLVPPAYGKVCIARHGKHGITLACYEAYMMEKQKGQSDEI